MFNYKDQLIKKIGLNGKKFYDYSKVPANNENESTNVMSSAHKRSISMIIDSKPPLPKSSRQAQKSVDLTADNIKTKDTFFGIMKSYHRSINTIQEQ